MFALFLLAISFTSTTTAKTANFTIGFLLNDTTFVQQIASEVQLLAVEYGNVNINVTWTLLKSDPAEITHNICERLISKGVHAIVTTNLLDVDDGSVDIVSYVGAFYKIPVIGVEERKSEFSDKNLHPTFLRMVSPYSEQASVWVEILKHFQWRKVNLLTSDDYDNRLTYIKFTATAYRANIIIENSVMFPTGEENLTSYLKVFNESQTKVIMLACSSDDALAVYRAARLLNLVGPGYIWISNEQATKVKYLKQTIQGLLTIQPSHAHKKQYFLRDAIKVLVSTLSFLTAGSILDDDPPASCDAPYGAWKAGEILYSSLINTTIGGCTGNLTFDWNGDRQTMAYDLLSVGLDYQLKEVGTIKNNKLTIDEDILWPGNQTEKPDGISVSNHLKIVTVESQPFVIIRAMHASNNCSAYKDNNYVQCAGKDEYGKDVVYCCKGFCIDLLLRLAERMGFTYDLYLVEDGNFGSLKRVNGTSIKRWNGMVGDVVEGKTDLIVASLTINNERAQYIEFSKPFKYQGITVLVKKKTEEENLVSFLRPFKTELWLLVLLSVHVVAVILYLLDRFSPFGRYRLAQSDKEETALDLSSAMWFSWGVLLNSGIGEGTPRSFSARVLGMVWAGFAMIIVASYTANLAAFLVLDRPKPKVTGIDDPELRNPSSSFKYATVANSSVDSYFRRQVELSSMYTFMEDYNVNTEQDGVRMVKEDKLEAFIWDSPVLFHETSKDCRLSTVGDLFGRSGYGIGMPKGFPRSNAISLAILHFHESGVMEELESRWISFGSCKSDENQPATLGLDHMLGVFIMVAVGIGAGIIIVILEVLYYKHKGWRKKQQNVLKRTTEHWQGHVLEKKNSRILTKQCKLNGIAMEEKNDGSPAHDNVTYESETSP